MKADKEIIDQLEAKCRHLEAKIVEKEQSLNVVVESRQIAVDSAWNKIAVLEKKLAEAEQNLKATDEHHAALRGGSDYWKSKFEEAEAELQRLREELAKSFIDKDKVVLELHHLKEAVPGDVEEKLIDYVRAWQLFPYAQVDIHAERGDERALKVQQTRNDLKATISSLVEVKRQMLEGAWRDGYLDCFNNMTVTGRSRSCVGMNEAAKAYAEGKINDKA